MTYSEGDSSPSQAESLPWLPPAGNQVQFTINVGITLNTDDGPLTLALYHSWSLVTDRDGYWQFFHTIRDAKYNGYGFNKGPAEIHNPSFVMSAGASLSWGPIEGSGFRDKGVAFFSGNAIDDNVSIGSLSVDRITYVNPSTGQPDPSMMTSYTAGYSWGAPVGISSVATETIGWGDPHPLPTALIPVCHALGMCGQYSILSSFLFP